MATYQDYITQGKTPQQIQDAIAKKFGVNSTEYQKYTTGKYALPAVTATPAVTTPVVTKTMNSIPVSPVGSTGSFGDISAQNVNAQTFEDTGAAMKARADMAAAEKGQISTEEGAAKQKLLEQRDAEKLARVKLQEDSLAGIDTEYKENAATRRADADKIFTRQDEIAARNANMAAAQAGESGVQMSQAAMEDIKNDVIAKYGQNIANAEQFKLQTNLSLDDALKNTGLQIFEKQGAIDTFKNALKDEEFAPVLNALTEAAQGKKDAAKDVYDYYKKFIDKKADEEYTSVAATETRARKENEWAAATPVQKISLIKAYAGDAMAPYIDAAINKIGDYGSLSMDVVLGKIAKIAKDDSQLNQAIDNYIYTGGKGNPMLDRIIAERGKDTLRAGDLSDLTKDKTIEQVQDLNTQYQNTNPLNLTNANNKAYYDTLNAAEKSRFATFFKAQDQTDRQKAFDGARAAMTQGNVETGPATTAQVKISPSNKAILDKQIAGGTKAQAIATLQKALANETSNTKRASLQESIRYLNQF